MKKRIVATFTIENDLQEEKLKTILESLNATIKTENYDN